MVRIQKLWDVIFLQNETWDVQKRKKVKHKMLPYASLCSVQQSEISWSQTSYIYCYIPDLSTSVKKPGRILHFCKFQTLYKLSIRYLLLSSPACGSLGQQMHVKHAPPYVVLQSQEGQAPLASSDLHNVLAGPLGLSNKVCLVTLKKHAGNTQMQLDH